MFKMQLQWNCQGEWHDCVFPPCSYDIAIRRLNEYQNRNVMHSYRIIPTLVHVMEDTPLAEAYGG